MSDPLSRADSNRIRRAIATGRMSHADTLIQKATAYLEDAGHAPDSPLLTELRVLRDDLRAAFKPPTVHARVNGYVLSDCTIEAKDGRVVITYEPGQEPDAWPSAEACITDLTFDLEAAKEGKR